MNATDLFGGPPDRSDLASPLVATDEPPKSAAYLFGGEAENGIPGSLQSKVLPVQDMPDDLFGDSGGGGNGGGRGSDGDMGGFGAPPVAPRSSGFSPPSNLQGVPDSLFGEPVVTRTTEEAFDFGPPSEPPGYAMTPGGYDGGNIHAESFLPPVDSTIGRSPPPISNDALEPPPPPRGDNAINALTEETQPRGAAANLDAPPNDIFGEPSSETVQWWGTSPPVDQLFSSAPSTETVPSINQAQTRPDANAMPSGQDRFVSPPPGDIVRVSSSRFSVSSSLPLSRPSSPPTENVFGAPPLGAPTGGPPVTFPGASPSSASLPNTGNPFRTERPRVNALDSPPPPPAQTFDTAPRIGLDGATVTTLSWTTNRSVPPHWTTQHQQSAHAESPQVGDEPHGNSMQSRVYFPAAGSLTVESSRCASEPSSVEIVPMDEGFAGLSQRPAKTGGGGGSSGEQPFGLSSGVMGDASRENPFGSSSGPGVASQANDIFGSSSGGNDIFDREGSTDIDQTSPLPPLQAPEALKGEGQPPLNPGFTATVAGDHQPAWSTEQGGVSGLGAPPGAPPRNVFDFEAGEDDDGSTPWWQTSMHKVDQVGTNDESSSVLYGNNTGEGVSEVAADRGIFDAPTDNSAWSVTHAFHTTAEVATQNESAEFEASSSAVFGAPVTDSVAAAEAKPMQDHATLVSGEQQQLPPQLIHEERDKGSNSPVASIPLESHSTLGVGRDAPTIASQEEHSPVDAEANPVLRQQEETSKGRESHGWDNQSLAPLQPDIYGAPPGELFGGANDDPFGAPEDGGEGFDDWGMCPAVSAPVSKPETSSGVVEACETRGVSVPEALTADCRNDSRNTFERKLDSLDVMAPKEEEFGKAMVVHPEEQAIEEHRYEEVKHPLLDHRDGARPEIMDTPAALTNTRSSFRLDYTSTTSLLEPSSAPSSPPRLFASRSASWAVRETTPESDSDFCEVFSNTEARRGGSPLRELTMIHGVERVENDEPAPILAMAAPNLTVLASPGESGVGETAEESSSAVEPSSRTVDSQQDAESGNDIDQASSLASPAGAWDGCSGTHAVEAQGFLLGVGSAISGHVASVPSPVTVQPHSSGAAEVAVGDVKVEKNYQACDKEEKRYPSSVTSSGTGTAVEHKADAGRTVNVDGDWNTGDDWSGGSDDRCSSDLRVDSPKGANKTEGGRLEARKEDSDEPERNSGVLGEEGPRNHPEDDRDASSGDGEGDNNRGLRKKEGMEVRAVGQTEEEDDMDDSFEISDEENDNVVSAVERTAADFFSTANSIPETKPESPTGIPPSESSRASLGSLSPLSEYGSLNRRQREDGRSGVGEAHRGLRSVGSSSGRSLGDVQNMFPSASIYRVRRSSLGRLPPPVPSYDPSASVRSTWRSLSPSRVNNFNGNEWSMRSPVLRDEQTGGTKGVRACSYSPSRQRVPGFKGTELGPGMLSLPPSRVPRRTFGQSGDSEGFARRGKTNVIPQSSEVVGAGQDQCEAETSCNSVGNKNFSSAAAVPQEHIQQPCQSFDGDPEGSSDVAEGVSSLSSPDLSKSPSIPLAEDDEIFSVEKPSPERKGKLEVPAPSQEATAHDGVDGTETSAREESSPALPPWKYHSGSSAGAGMGQTPPPLPPPPTQLASNVARMEDVSKAVPSAIEARGPPSRDASKYGTMAEHVNDVVEVDNYTAENGAVGEDRKGLTRVAAPQRPQPIFLSPDLFGEHILDSRVSSQPSHLVNKDSPLTRPRKEKSLFDNDSPECEDGGEGNKSVSSAADLFATEAPAAPADELFAVQPPEAPEATPYGAEQSFEGNVEGGNDNHDPFSQGPPPLPLQSLPNPWGSSPLKQPLTGPKSRPTKGGTGFDRPPVQPPLPADKTPGHGMATGFEDAEGGRPAVFVDLGSQGAGEGGFDAAPKSGAKAGGNTSRAAPASFMSPFVAPDSSTASVFVTKPRENNHRVLPSDVVEVSRESLPLPTGNPFASFRRPGAPSAVLPPAGKPVHHRVSSGFSVKSGGSGGWGSTAAAAAATGGADKSQRDPNVRPPGVLAMFGFGGKLVCTYPRQKIKLAPAPGVVPPPDDGSEFQSGPVMLWSLKDLAEPGKILRDPEAFPGPASSAPVDKLKGYVESRVKDAANDGEKLLWSIASLALQFKGCLASDAVSTDANSPEAAIVKLLKNASARRREAGRDATLTPTPSPLPAPMSPVTLGGASWRPAPRPHTSYPPRDPREGSLLRPGHRTVGSDGGGGGVGSGGAFFGGVTPPRVAAGVGPFGTAAPMEGRSVARTEGMGTGSREEVEALLVDGKKEEAVDASINAGLWGLALLIAAQCSASPMETGSEGDGGAPPQPPYQRVVRLYANAFLQSGTPLHTLALAFSGQAEAAIKHGGKSLGGPIGVGGDSSLGQGGFKDTWMATAAAILSNKVPGWREQLIGLGDRLMESDEVPAAHALFLVAGLQADLPTTKEARLVLPGVDHRKPEHKGLRTREATDAVHLLEVLDVAWKDGRGRCSAVQGHKLRLAMRLADAGFLQKAYEYVVNTQAEVAAISGPSGIGPERRNPYSPQFISALKNFEDRLRAALDSEDAVKAGQVGLGKERSAGSAAAGAGRWLLDGVANIVKKSATPGPMQQGPRAASGAQSNVPNPDALTREPGTGRTYPPKAVSKPEEPTRVPPQHHQRAFPGGAAYARNSRVSSLPGSSSAPAAWRAPQQVPVRGQQPFGPRPPGVQTGWPMPSTGDEQQSYKKPQSEAASPLNAARDYSVDSVEEMRPVIPSPPRSFGSSRTLSPPLPGMPGVTKILGGGEEDNGARSKGMTHVSSAPVLSGGVLGDQTPPTDKKPDAAAGPKKGAARGESEQPPKSDSSKDKKGKAANSPSSVGKKPGMWAKMMARWLHPDAKFADVGKEMEAYYDEKTKRWVFPGEDPNEAAPAAPSMPPTASQLAAPGPSAPQPTPRPEANDPLAALMAPPPSFVGATKLAMSGAAPGGGPPKMSGGIGAGAGGGPPTMGAGPPTGGLSWASKGAPPMSTWGGNRGPVKSPFAVARKSTAPMPKAPSSTSSTAGEGESVSGGGDS